MLTRNVNVPEVLRRLGIEPKTKGRELWACCPIHRTKTGDREKTPSFRVRNDPGGEIPKHTCCRFPSICQNVIDEAEGCS